MASVDPIWDLIERIGRAGDVYALRSATMAALDHLGFGAAYFLAPVVADPRAGRVLSNIGFPQNWEKDYESGQRLVDPLPGLALTRQSAFFWPDSIRSGEIDAEGEAYLASLVQHGMERGIAVPCFGPFARCGFVGVGKARTPECYNELTRLQVEICARRSFRRYVRLAQPFADIAPQLSAQEHALLHELADGRDDAEIAQRLGQSAAAIGTMVGVLLDKLEVGDRTRASVRALALGMVIAGAYPRRSR